MISRLLAAALALVLLPVLAVADDAPTVAELPTTCCEAPPGTRFVITETRTSGVSAELWFDPIPSSKSTIRTTTEAQAERVAAALRAMGLDPAEKWISVTVRAKAQIGDDVGTFGRAVRNGVTGRMKWKPAS